MVSFHIYNLVIKTRSFLKFINNPLSFKIFYFFYVYFTSITMDLGNIGKKLMSQDRF